jgi:hypothetical protein
MRRILILVFAPTAGLGFWELIWELILVVVGVLLFVHVLRGGDLSPRDHYVMVSKDLVRHKCSLNRHEWADATTTCSGTITNESDYRQYALVITTGRTSMVSITALGLTVRISTPIRDRQPNGPWRSRQNTRCVRAGFSTSPCSVRPAGSVLSGGSFGGLMGRPAQAPCLDIMVRRQGCAGLGGSSSTGVGWLVAAPGPAETSATCPAAGLTGGYRGMA